MGFWSDTWDTIVEQATLGPPGSPGRSTAAERDAFEKGASELGAQVKSVAGNFVELARTATEVTAPWGYDPEQIQAYEDGVRGLPEQLKAKASDVITLAKWATKPWVIAGAVVVVVLVVLAPYVTPFLRRPQ